MLTRTLEQGAAMAGALKDLGARVISFPTIKLIPPPDESIIQRALSEIDSYDWIVFTSVNAVHNFFNYYTKLIPQDKQTSQLGPLPKIAVVGPATGQALEAYGASPSAMAKNFQAEGLVEMFAAFPQAKQQGSRILIPRALEARDVLEKQLPEFGYEVSIAPVYQTVQAEASAEQIAGIKHADAIVFSSPSTVRYFVNILDGADDSRQQAADYLKSRKIFSIGPVTTAELHRQHLAPTQIFEAKESTAESLVSLLAKSL